MRTVSAMTLVLLCLLWPTLSMAAVPAGFAQLAPDCLVIYGKNATPVEKQAATDIAVALRTVGGPATNLLDDETASADLNLLITHHLILVGTYGSNDLLHQQWGHWAIDRPAYVKEATAPAGAPHPPFYDGMPTQGFYVCGFGTFLQPDTGYLESGRNDLYLLPIAMDTPQKTGYRIRLNVTGASPQGVARAARCWLLTGCLGAVIPTSAEVLSTTTDMLSISKAQYNQDFRSGVLWRFSRRLCRWFRSFTPLQSRQTTCTACTKLTRAC